MKAVFFINTNRNYGHVSHTVWDMLREEGYLQNATGMDCDGQEVMMYTDGEHEYYFAPTDIAVCRDYPRYLPFMNRYFADFYKNR